MRTLRTVTGLVLLWFVLPAPAKGDTVTLMASRDNTIYQGAPNSSNGAGQGMFVGVTGQGPGNAARGLLGFDVASQVPAGSTITGVQVRLVLDQASTADEGSARLIQLCRLVADWGEGTTGKGNLGSHGGSGFLAPADGSTATWGFRFFSTTPWATPGGDFVPTASSTATVGKQPGTVVLWDTTPALVSDVQGWLDNPASNFGWLVLGDEAADTSARRFFTRESPNPANQPALIVTYSAGSPATSQLVVTAPPSVTAGAPFDITVTALDANGNVATGYSGTVSLSSSDPFPGALPAAYTFTAADQGTHTFSAGGTLFTGGSQTLTVQDTGNNILLASTSIAVTAAPASQLLVTAPSSVVTGTPFDVTVTAVDPYGNVDPNYAGTITWASTDADPGVLLPPDYTFQTTDMGTVTIPAGVTLITIGDQALAVADTVQPIVGVTTVTVTAGP